MRSMHKKTKASHYLLYTPPDPYYVCCIAGLIRTKSIDKTLQYILPSYGIRFHESTESRFPKWMKRINNELQFIKSQYKICNTTTNLLKSHLKKEAARHLRVIRPTKWLAVYYLNFFGIKNEARKIIKNNSINMEDIKKNGVKIGDLVIDTFLRLKGEPSFQRNEKFTESCLIRGIALIQFTKRIIRKYEIDVFVGTTNAYIQNGVPLRTAGTLNIPIVTFGAIEKYFKLTAAENSDVTTHILDYPRPEDCSVDETIRTYAAKTLEMRINGEYDNTIPELEVTNTKGLDPSHNFIQDSVVLLLHDFLDSPHIYRSMIFNDFWSWANETIEFCLSRQQRIIIKSHPGELPESSQVTKNLSKLFVNHDDVIFIEPSIPTGFIFKAKPKLIVSVYGSVATEAACNELPVLLAGDHPAIHYNIGSTARTKEEYFQLLSHPEMVSRGNKKAAIDYTAKRYKYVFAKEMDSLATHFNINLNNYDQQILKSKPIISYVDKMSKIIIEELQYHQGSN